jgi:hypothetical protein
VTVEVTPNDGTADGSAVNDSATVANSAPTVSLDGANSLTANEGDTKSYAFTAADADGDTLTFASSYPLCAHGSLVGSPTVGSGSFQCTFPDGPNNSTIAVKVKDSDNAVSGESTQPIAIANVPPTATLSNNGPVGEGSAATVSFSGASDPSSTDTAASFHYAYACDNSSLAGATYAGSGTSASTPCTYDDGPSDHTVKARIIDKDGGYTEYTTVVHVTNLNPTGTLSNNGPVGEGSAATVSFSGASDPSSTDTAASFHYAYACDNSSLAGATYAGSGTNASTPCTYDDGPSDHTVKARIIDKDGGYTEYTTSVHVNNVPPTATFSNDGPVAEGSDFHLYLTSPSDPSNADTAAGFQYQFDCGSGYGSYSSSASATCSTSDSGVRTVHGRIKDQDGGYSTYTATVTVNNAPPVVTAPSDQGSNEGENKSFTLGSFSDPGTEGTNGWTVDVNWGDGSPHSSFQVSSAGAIPAASHTYTDNGSYTVIVRVTDKENGYDSKSFSVSVANVPPAVTAPSDQSSNEGQNKAFDLGSFSDPGIYDAGSYGWSVDVNWGDGSAHTTFYQGTPGSLGTRYHTYADNGSYTVTVSVTDKDGGSNTKTFAVSVANVPPAVTAPTNQSSNEGESHSFNLGSFSDPGAEGANGWTVDVDWGDGSTHANFGVGSTGTIPARSHSYDDNGVYTITVQVTDKDHASDSKTFSLTVNNVAPTASIANSGPIFEGTSATVSFTGPSDASGADTTAGFHYAFSCVNGDLSGATYAGSGTSDWTTCSYDDGPSDRTVKARVIDKDGGFAEYTTVVHVNNLPPTASFSNDGPANEGSSFHLYLTGASDPSSADTAAGFQYQFDCGSGYGSWGTSSSATCATSDNGVRTVHARVRDKDLDYTTYNDTVAVNNVPPTVTAPADQSSNEGQNKSFTLGSFTDPGTEGTNGWTVDVNWGDGSTHASFPVSSTGAIPATSHAYDDNGSYTVTVKVTDKDGGYGTKTFAVSVSNLPPTGTFGGPSSGIWGVGHTFAWTAQTDPSAADTTAGLHYAYSCTGGDLSAATYGGSGGTSSIQCTYPSPSTYTVKSRIIDKDGGYTERTATIVIAKRTTTLTYNGATSGQYSDRPTLSAALLDQLNQPVANRTITFTIGSLTTSATTDANGVATSTGIQLGQPATTTVSAAFSASGDTSYTASSAPSRTFTINQEDAALDYSGDNIGLTGVNATLRATVWDSAASGYPGGGNDSTIGDITKMWVKFTVYQTSNCGSTATATLWAQVADTGTQGDGIGTATTSWGPGNNEATYCVRAELVSANQSASANLWYAADPTVPAGLTIYANTGQFVTGGGWVQDALSSNGHGNFGFNARFNNNNKPQGQLVYVYRGTYNGVEADYVIKSNALNSLGFQCWNGSAYVTCPIGNNTYPALSTLQGKATIQINRSSDGVSLYSDGSATFNASVLDNGAPSGTDSDRFTLRVWDKNGVLYRQVGNMDGPPPYYGLVFLKGGNVVIHPSK